MSAFRAETAPRRAALAAALWLAALSPAPAQEPPPVPPLPPIPDAEAGTPLSLAPEAAPTPQAGEDGISLGALGGDAAGGLAPEAQAFGGDLWRGDGRRLVGLLERLPTGARSPAMRSLMRRLLAAPGAPPPGALPEGAFVGARIALLSRLGAFDEAARIADSAGDAAAPWPRAEARFWRGENERACALADAAIAAQPDRRWNKALVLCLARRGETAAAGLALALLADRAEDGEAPWLRLAARAVGQVAEAAPVLDDALGYAATVAAGAALSPEHAAAASAAAARALALDPAQPAETRLAAAERAAALGAFSGRELADAYRAAAGPADPVAGDGETETGSDAQESEARARARLFLQAATAGEDERRAAALAALWAGDETPEASAPGFPALARMAAETVLLIAPDPRLAWFAPAAMRALATAGYGEAAAAWRRALGVAAPGDAAAEEAIWRSLPLVLAAGADIVWDAESAARWWRAAPPDMDPSARASFGELAFMVLDASGRRIGAEGWAPFLDEPALVETAIPNIGLRYGMRDAARAGRVGEALTLALILLGDGGPAAAGPVAVGAVIRVLRAFDLKDDARAVAVEALTGAAS